MADTLTLVDDRWKVTVAPSLGGSLLACEYDGAEILRPTPQPAGGGRPAVRCCHFPLVPFSNRVADGRFAFEGRRVVLTPNVAGSPHAMHGHGWQMPWQVRSQDAASCLLEYEREATDDWPWAYAACQQIALAGGALTITLVIANRDAAAMPCGLGFHPFLPKTEGARLAFNAARVFDGRAAEFPAATSPVGEALSFTSAPRIAAREGADHCYADWDGTAMITDDDRATSFRLEGCEATRYAIVYIPAGDDYFCVEPVTHAVNAMNHADPASSGLWRLVPGEVRGVTLTLRPLVTPRG